MSVETLEASVGLSPPRRRWHVAWLVAVAFGLVAVALAAFSIAGRSASVPSAPIFASGDGLPRALVPGASYTATLSIAVPGDWSASNALNEQLPVVVGATLATAPDVSDAPILCTSSVLPGDIVTLSCPLTAPVTSGTPVIISVGVGTRTYVGTAPAIPAEVQHVYSHIVR